MAATDSDAKDNSAEGQSSIAVSIDGRIAEDKLCIECGYNLRTLRTDAHCTECGQPVADSLKGQELAFASVPWLRVVCRGFRLLNLAIAIMLGWILVFFVAAVLADSGGRVESVIEWLRLPMKLLVCGLASVGLVFATRVEPRVAHRGEGLSARRLARVFAFCAVVLRVGLDALTRIGPKNAVVDLIMIVLPLCVPLMAAAAACAFVQHVVGLVARTAEEKTLKSAKQTRIAVVATVVLLTISSVGGAAAQLFDNPQSDLAESLTRMSSTAHSCSSCLTVVSVLAGMVLISQVNSVLRKTLREVQARENHTAGTSR